MSEDTRASGLVESLCAVRECERQLESIRITNEVDWGIDGNRRNYIMTELECFRLNIEKLMEQEIP